jgi:ribosome biogenesis GTPase A
MAVFWKAVNDVIREANILLEIIDARDVAGTRNPEIEDKIRHAGKIMIYVLNKCDLADQKELEKVKKTLSPCVFVSCKDYHGIKMLRERIIIEGKRLGDEKIVVGVLGYPNMGKSSVINALNGMGKAKVSSKSGFTRGKQYITARGFVMIDTPGVIPYMEKDAVKHSISGIKTETKDPEGDVLRIMEARPGLIENHYGVALSEDKEESLEAVCVKLNLLLKGGKPDMFKASQRILRELRSGIIKI